MLVRSRKKKGKKELKKGPVPGYEAYTTPQGKEVYLLDRERIKANFAADVSKLTKEEKDLRKQMIPCFWIPGLTPDNGKRNVALPSKHTICPAGLHTLRVKQLRPIRFTRVSEEERLTLSKKKEFMSNNGKYICCGCQRTLTNTTNISLLSSCGHVHCNRCIEGLVKKDKVCVQCGEHVKEKSIIPIQYGATGFAAHGASNAVAKPTPAFQG